MSEKIEQIGKSPWTNLPRKKIKKATHRKERRQAKKNLEDAPKKRHYKGYAD